MQIKLLNTPQPVTKKIDSTPVLEKSSKAKTKIDSDKCRVNFPRKYFKSVGEALPYLFKRLPLWSNEVKKPNFRSVCPCVAGSQAEFSSWNVGRQLSSEVCNKWGI